jgi:hypothetical protein
MDDFDVNRFKQKLANGEISRRQLGKILAAAGIVTTVMPLASRAKADDADGQAVCTAGPATTFRVLSDLHREVRGTPEFSIWNDEEEAILKINGGYQPDTVFRARTRFRNGTTPAFSDRSTPRGFPISATSSPPSLP